MNVRKYLAGILVLAFIARVAVMVHMQTWNFSSEREFGYEEGEIAYAIANGQGFSWPQTWRAVGPPGAMVKYDHPEPTTWKAPVAPSIIAVAFWLFGSYSTRAAVALELFQILLSLISVYVVFHLGKTVFSEATGLVAAAILALYPTSIYFAVQKIEYGSLLTLLGLILIQQTLVLAKRPTVARGLVLGAIAGVATLVNPVILAFCPPAVLWFLWTCEGEWRTRLKSAVAITGCCVAVLVPWLVRNYMVFDQFMFVRSNFAREFVRSNSEKDRRELRAENTTSTNEAQSSNRLNRRAISLVLEKPASFLANVAIRFRNFWTNLSQVQGGTRLALGTAYYSVLCCALAGLWGARKYPQVTLLMIYLATMPIPFYLTWARLMRFRFPIEPVLILFAAYAVTSMAGATVKWRPAGAKALGT